MRFIPRAYQALLDSLAAIAGALLVLTTLAVVLDVSARYFAGTSFAWVFELTEYVLLYVPCLGMAWLVRRRGHITIDIVTSHIPPAGRHRLFVATSLVTALVCGFIAYWGFLTTYDFYVRDLQSEKVLTVPMWVLLGCIPLGFGLTAIEFVRVAVSGEQRVAQAEDVPGPGEA